MPETKTDIEVIEWHGGTTQLAKKLGCTPQRVENWKKRGIPAKVKLDNPELFLKKSAQADHLNKL